MKPKHLNTLYGVAALLLAAAVSMHSWIGVGPQGVVIGYGATNAVDAALLWMGGWLSLVATLICIALARWAQRPPTASAYFKTDEGELRVPSGRLYTFHPAVRFCSGTGILMLLSLALVLRWNHDIHIAGFSFYVGLTGLTIAGLASHPHCSTAEPPS